MRKQLSLMAGLAPLILSACAQAVPDDKAAYVGEWHAQNFDLSLSKDGKINYKRVNGNSSRSIDGPLRRFEGDDFVVGIPFITTTFVVSKPPHQEGGAWKMTVDGVELTRAK